jgi:hypothetical protein
MYYISFLHRNLTLHIVRLPSSQICLTLGNRKDIPSRLDDADSEKYSTVTSFPICCQTRPREEEGRTISSGFLPYLVL